MIVPYVSHLLQSHTAGSFPQWQNIAKTADFSNVSCKSTENKERDLKASRKPCASSDVAVANNTQQSSRERWREGVHVLPAETLAPVSLTVSSIQYVPGLFPSLCSWWTLSLSLGALVFHVLQFKHYTKVIIFIPFLISITKKIILWLDKRMWWLT